jgi:hypothetical protein
MHAQRIAVDREFKGSKRVKSEEPKSGLRPKVDRRGSKTSSEQDGLAAMRAAFNGEPAPALTTH